MIKVKDGDLYTPTKSAKYFNNKISKANRAATYGCLAWRICKIINNCQVYKI